MEIKSIFCLSIAPASLFSILQIWKQFHVKRLVFPIKKHTLHLHFVNSSPEKFASNFGNWKWEKNNNVLCWCEIEREFVLEFKQFQHSLIEANMNVIE